MVISRRTLIIGGVIAVTIALIVTVILLASPAKPGPSGSTSTSTATSSFTLPPGEEQKVKSFVKLFSDLYNTYGYGDYHSAINQATFGTPAFQEKTEKRFEPIVDALTEGYYQKTETDLATFSYVYPAYDQLQTSIKGTVTEYNGDQVTKTYSVRIDVSLIKQAADWVVSDVIITPQI